MAKKFSDNEQKNFEMAVDAVFASASRLRGVTQEKNWDDLLTEAWQDFSHKVNDAIEARNYLR